MCQAASLTWWWHKSIIDLHKLGFIPYLNQTNARNTVNKASDMKTNLPSKSLFAVVLTLTTLAFVATTPLNAAGRKKNPTSKLYVADTEGTSEIDTGEKIAELNKRSVYSAEGTVIETKADSTNAMVFSNGTGIHFDADTRLEIQKFVQEPFTPNRSDMEVEPSISNTRTFLPRGTVGLCTSKMVAGSTMRYATPNASIRINARKAVIQSSNEGTTVSVMEGEVTVQAGDNDAGGYVVKPGQQAFMPSGGGPVQVMDIPQDQLAALDDKVTMACMARKTVYFEAKDKADNLEFGSEDDVTAFDTDEQEIVAIETTPAAKPAAESTVSAANFSS